MGSISIKQEIYGAMVVRERATISIWDQKPITEDPRLPLEKINHGIQVI